MGGTGLCLFTMGHGTEVIEEETGGGKRQDRPKQRGVVWCVGRGGEKKAAKGQLWLGHTVDFGGRGRRVGGKIKEEGCALCVCVW